MNLKSLFQTMMTIGFILSGFILNQTPAVATTTLCKDVISQQESQKGIPQDLLKAIAKVESGISPWAVNAHGRAHMFHSKEAAARYVKQLVEDGQSNFSVGCMQLHYASHRRNFKSIEAMLEPENNIAHAARLIKALERRHGSMERAVKLYHSPSPAHHNLYKNRVYGMWAKIRGPKRPTMLKTVALKKEIPQEAQIKKVNRSTKIKFGVGGASSKKNQRAKI
jgi:soluble lytic murein transglycosylase-like protein